MNVLKFKSSIFWSIVIWCFFVSDLKAQTGSISGRIHTNDKSLSFVSVGLDKTKFGTFSNEQGYYAISNIPYGNYQLVISAIGYERVAVNMVINELNKIIVKDIHISETGKQLDEVVISGTLKETSKLESPVPIEVYTGNFFKANPTPSLFDALQNINGVRPQLNCNICNTGDIHINGLEGPFTMILIDGMSIVSGLSTLYGLSGIPQSLIERVEIVKGPASTLYGSEAVGGLINVITKRPSAVPIISMDLFGTSWAEVNADIASKFKVGKKANALLSLNSYWYDTPYDKNEDGFTDVTLQKRVSVFNKWHFERKDNRLFSIGGRYIFENRWGGDMLWNSSFRGGDSIYGEDIDTKRWELFGVYQLPIKEKVMLHFSANKHHQNSAYGQVKYIATQNIGFGQVTWHKQLGRSHDALAGAAIRYTFYDDNTSATSKFDTINSVTNQPSIIYLPGLFLQDEIALNANHKLLLGVRYDYNSLHGSIFTPRINYKWSSKNKKNILRLSAGNGYRIVNVFTEDHAALTGARTVEFLSDLKPETSYNANINVVKKVYTQNNHFFGFDATAFYTYFTNKIFANYDANPNKIIYDNLNGFAVSKGLSLNMDVTLNNGLKMLFGGTLMDVSQTSNNEKTRQVLTERYTAVWNLSYTIEKIDLSIDYTGNLYGPMRLPLLGALDPRPANSPAWSIQNIQLTKKMKLGFEMYGGIKNILNWTPAKDCPFLIARSNDPFDKQVTFDNNGQVLATSNNPYALSFDPNYVYAPNQGIRMFLGVRYQFNRSY